MNVFSKIPWKIIGGFVPELAEIVKQAKGYAGNGENSETEELKRRVVGLEAAKDHTYGAFKFVLVSGIIIFLISITGLILGIIALTR